MTIYWLVAIPFMCIAAVGFVIHLTKGPELPPEKQDVEDRWWWSIK